jgi:thiamine biosynthesis protein ThiS
VSTEIDAPPQLTVNGEAMALADLATLGDLLARLKVAPERVVVELNGVIYRRGEGLGGRLQAGDVIEIVHFVGGG